MSSIQISMKIQELRKKKGVTQDDLAAFLNVTKASVSKWENEQSYPDILLLPQIANFFGITIDELLSYKPQLSEEQITKEYITLAENFAVLPFDEAMKISRDKLSEYYSCYPFIIRIVTLWINHFMISDSEEVKKEILKDCLKLCNKVINECNIVTLCSDATILKALVSLQLNNTAEVIEILSETFTPERLSEGAEVLLIQAYQMSGRPKDADTLCQTLIYADISKAISISVNYMALHMDDEKLCWVTIERVNELIKVFNMEVLNRNICAQYYYQAAVFYSMHNELREAIEALKRFAEDSIILLAEENPVQGDEYFTLLEEWYRGLDTMKCMPRSNKVIFDSVLQSLKNPVFMPLFDNADYKSIVNEIKRRSIL